MTASELVSLIEELLLHPMVVHRSDIVERLNSYAYITRHNMQNQNRLEFIRRRLRNLRHGLVLHGAREEQRVEEVVEPVVERHICPYCRAIFSSGELLGVHSIYHTQADESYVVGSNHLVRNRVTALTGLVRDYKMWSDDVVYDIPLWMREQENLMESCLSPLMRSFSVSAMFYVCMNFVQVNAEGVVLARREGYIPSRASESIVDLHEWYESHISKFSDNLEKYLNVDGSDWMIDGLNFVLLKVGMRVRRAGRGAFKLPETLKKRRAVVNVECENACFKYAVLSVLHYDDIKKDRQRVSKYKKWEHELKFDGLDVEEVDIQRDVPKFEEMNDVKVNVHLWDGELKGIQYSSTKIASHIVNLLLVVNENGQQHYCGIPTLSRLYHHTQKTHVCEQCKQSFKNEQSYKTHVEWCRKVAGRKNIGGCTAFKLPETLKKRRAVVNVECESACFKYAVLSVLHYDDIKQDRQRVSKYEKWEHELKFDGLDVNRLNIQRDVPKFEKMNDVKVNIHVWEKGLQGIRYNNRKNTAKRTVNLLLIVNEDGHHHYCAIPTLARLYHHIQKSHNMPFTCARCGQLFKAEHTYNTHYEWCSRGKAQIEEMPKERDYKYTDLGYELSPLRVVYADAECYIESDTQNHLPAAIAMYDVWHAKYDDRSCFKAWDGEECVEGFLKELEQMAKDQFIQDNLTRQKMLISPQQHIDYNQCTVCPKCHKSFTENNKKVRDHDHITGKFRGALCHTCNARLSLKRNILPVMFHNLKNYDAHLIIKHGIGKFKHWQLSVIAQTTEKFMTIRAKVPVGQSKTGKTIFFDIVFIDTYQFMTSSLSNLAQNLTSLPLTEKLKQDIPSLSTDILRRKGVFPYTYFSSLHVLDETSLPPRDSFKNDLTDAECSEEDYAHAHRAWREFRCKTFKDYMMRYLELDVRILADVFEEFRRMSLRQDGLDPVHFVSLPSLSFMSAFKMTGETIHLLQDPHLYNLFERGIRGGLTFINTHHAKEEVVRVENRNMKHILLYIDQNNLYGAAMSEFLPHSNFVLLTDDDINKHFPNQQHILNLDTEGDQGYYFEVDLRYPPHIHRQTADFPLAPETAQVTYDMMSTYMKETFSIIQTNRTQDGAIPQKFKPSYKLLLSQNDKKNYCIHFKLLQYFIRKGMQVTKVHSVVQFTQKQFLKPYIDFNSRQRAQAQNTFEKDFYKLKNNSLFGKTMEDVRKHSNYKLVTEINKWQKLLSSPLFHHADIITEDIVGVKMTKPKVTLNRPIYIGQAVLDHSKHAMYTLFYETLPSCPLIHDIKLLGGDTDSFFLSLTVEQHITTGDILSNMKQYVDFSNYPPTHPLHSNINKAKLGCFKDEVAGREIEEMILLRPKMYSIKIKEEEGGIRRAKGISRSVVKNMRHVNYQQAYNQLTESRVSMTILKSISHSIHTLTFNKRGLSCWDDKRVWLSANVSLPHGNVESPVSLQKPKCVLPPPSGDVGSVSAVEPPPVKYDVSAVERLPLSRNAHSSVVDMSGDDESDVGNDESVVEDERGEAVGFDDDEEEEEESENETEEDRMFIDDELYDVEDVAPLRKRILMDDDDDEIFDVATLAKRCRF